MAISLYDASVASFLQVLGAVGGFLEKGRAHLAANGVDLGEVVETRLYPDMLPFRFQLVSVAHHSLGAIRGVEAGVFGPPARTADLDYAALQRLVADAAAGLQALSREHVDGLEGREVVFQIGDRRMPFTAEGFLLTFSLPNLHFHATTAYDMLRMRGVPIGKRDYMGRTRTKG
jgi:hypothetical protein